MSKSFITDEERTFIAYCRTREVAVLQNLDETQVGQGVLLGCGDADRMIEAFDTHRRILRQQGIPDRIHPVFLNGGPALFWEHHPMSDIGRFVLQNIFEGLALKEMNRLIIYAHWPCGKAREQDLGLIDMLESLLIVKRRVKELLPETEVTLRLHVDWLDGGHMDTYHVPYPTLLRHLESLKRGFPLCSKFNIPV